MLGRPNAVCFLFCTKKAPLSGADQSPYINEMTLESPHLSPTATKGHFCSILVSNIILTSLSSDSNKLTPLSLFFFFAFRFYFKPNK